MDKQNLRKMKIAVIGLDGGSFKIIKPMMEKGLLPNLKKIMENGASGTLMSTVPPLSPQAWASFMTGKNPGKHGIFDFTNFKPDSYEMTFSNGSCVRSKTLWRLLSDCGLSVGVVNVPMTYPAEEVNGYLLSGFEAPSVNNKFSWPENLNAEIKAAIGKDFDLHGDFWTKNAPDIYLNQILKTMNNQADAVKYLIKQYPTDFFMYVFGSTDRVQHYFWQFQDTDHPDYTKGSQFESAIERVYVEADRLAGEILEMIPDPKTVFVVSDHGFGPLKKIVYLDKWLEQNGYLVWKQEKISKKNVLLKNLYMTMRLYLPQKLKDILKALYPAVRASVESSLILGDVDWKKTKAFAVGVEATSIFINRNDRFPLGSIKYQSNEYEKLISELVQGIMNIKDPDTGEPVAGKIFKTAEIYNGREVKNAPDLIVQWKNHEYVSRRHYRDFHQDVVSKELKSGVMGKLMSLSNTGCHRPEGMFMASGPDIKSNFKFDSANIIDFFPTLLDYLGIKQPSGVDGKIFDLIFKEDGLKTFSGKYSSGEDDLTQPGCDNNDIRISGSVNEKLNKDEEDAIFQRLKNLGYLE